MIRYVYAIKDLALGEMDHFFVQRSKGEAIRTFAQSANDRNSLIFTYPTDYELWCLGTVDTQTGEMRVSDGDSSLLERIGTALDFREEDKQVDIVSQMDPRNLRANGVGSP